jgi:hypothetical protein
MCKVYNPVGSLTTIKSHLHEHDIYEYKSVNELINFQKNYTTARQQIISNHTLLIEEEKNTLNDEIVRLYHSVNTKKNEIEQELLLELEQLNYRLNDLNSNHYTIINTLFNYIKKIDIKQKIRYKKLTFNSKIAHSLEYLTNDYNEKNTRSQYIASFFEDAVEKSSLPQLNEIDRKKRIIEQINNTIYGALGEQKVSKELEKLSDDYILINDFTYRFNPPIYHRKENDYILSIQIDHILLSPSGIFLIETKNWSQHSLNNSNLHSPVQQIKRTNYALYRVLNEEISIGKFELNKHYWGDRKIQIRNLIVFINHKPIEEFQHVKILTLNDLLSYVKYFKPCLSTKEIQSIAGYLLNLTNR